MTCTNCSGEAARVWPGGDVLCRACRNAIAPPKQQPEAAPQPPPVDDGHCRLCGYLPPENAVWVPTDPHYIPNGTYCEGESA